MVVQVCVTDPILGIVKLSKLLMVWLAGSSPNDSQEDLKVSITTTLDVPTMALDNGKLDRL